jgi:RimJ/RimL family protein N-acetyltransferase
MMKAPPAKSAEKGSTSKVRMGIQGRSETYTRRLHSEHFFELSQLLATAPGFTLFLTSNLERFGLDDPFIHFWGAFRGDELVGALMMAGQRAGVYAQENEIVSSLMEIALRQKVNFIMGRRELVHSALRSLTHLPIARSEAHFFATLEPERFRAPLAAQMAPASIRKATPDDIQGLTHLYTGAAGFERVSADQVRQSMIERVYTLRTYVADVGGRLVAGASTSAESSTAAMIGGVWTLPNERDHGYSTAVVAALCADLLAEGRQPYLFYLEDNAPAARVYTKLGFEAMARWSVIYFERVRS